MEETYRGHTIKVLQDTDPMNPRIELDNLGTMICLHSRYTLGDKHNFKSPKEFLIDLALKLDPTLSDRIEHNEKLINLTIDKHCVMLNIYLFEHSGLTMNTEGFYCPWDSGQVGYIYASKESIFKEFSGKKYLTNKLRKKVAAILRGEVEVYSNYIEGNVFGYEIEDSEGEFVNSCGMYFGYPETSGLIEDAKESINCEIEDKMDKNYPLSKEIPEMREIFIKEYRG